MRHLNTGWLEKRRCPRSPEAFAALCDRIGPDLTVALEFMPYSGARPGHRLAGAAGRRPPEQRPDHRCLALGAGQHDNRPTSIGRRPTGSSAVQLCDVLEHRWTRRGPSPSGIGSTRPGWGDASAGPGVAREGWRPAVLAVEVISDELVAGGVERAARTVADAARTVLAQADQSPQPALSTPTAADSAPQP